ncbi:MAG: YciI family protein [Chthoniobacter sp.]
MLMIPAVYQPGNQVDPNFVPDPKKIAAMGKFNEELGKAVKILSLNGLHPQSTGARVAFGQGKPTVTTAPSSKPRKCSAAIGWSRPIPRNNSSNGPNAAPPTPATSSKSRQIFDPADFAIQK